MYTFTELLLHGVPYAVNGGVVLRIQDVGGRGPVGDGHQFRGGDLVAHTHGEHCYALSSSLHAGVHLMVQEEED